MRDTQFSISVLRKRTLCIFIVFLLLFCAIGGRFFYVQVVWSGELKGKALDQWTREIPIIAERGKIVDRNGVSLVENGTTFSIFARSNAVKNKEKTARLLAEILEEDFAKLLGKLEGKKASEVTIAKGVSKAKIEKLSASMIEGVYFSRENQRNYPYDELLCQVLGFTSSDSHGLSGLEKYYESVLTGKNGELLYETDLIGIELNGAVAAYKEATPGYSLQLTIDHGIQSAVEGALAKASLAYSPKSAECIVIDPSTFEILALATTPSYDLNDIPRDDLTKLNELSRNHIVCDIYEPGSTFKVVTVAANLEEYFKGNHRAFSPTHIFSSSRTRQVDGTTVKCWSNHQNGKHSNQTIASALNNSCNPCFTDMALSLGKETFYKYLSAFGFGERTGIDYGGEAYGMVLPEKIVRGCDLARIGFGQTIATSGLQLACATASIINGGKYYTPHLVKKIFAQDGYVLEEVQKQLQRETVSEKTSELLREMLEGVVKDGSGKKAYIEGYRVGGKTGTAQKYENGHIAQGKYVSSFVGFFPANAPKYLALVIVDEPQGAYYGSVVAAPVAREVFEGIISLKNIPPFV